MPGSSTDRRRRPSRMRARRRWRKGEPCGRTAGFWVRRPRSRSPLKHPQARASASASKRHSHTHASRCRGFRLAFVTASHVNLNPGHTRAHSLTGLVYDTMCYNVCVSCSSTPTLRLHLYGPSRFSRPYLKPRGSSLAPRSRAVSPPRHPRCLFTDSLKPKSDFNQNSWFSPYVGFRRFFLIRPPIHPRVLRFLAARQLARPFPGDVVENCSPT